MFENKNPQITANYLPSLKKAASSCLPKKVIGDRGCSSPELVEHNLNPNDMILY